MAESTEIRFHGRGGQGGVTGAKLVAAAYASLGKSVQTFGDYAAERSGAPVRAYTRVGDEPITNRNKVYEPDHLVVLDHHLLGPDVFAGLKPGGTILLNSPEPLARYRDEHPDVTFAVVDATAIARRHGIGSRSVVIVNTTIVGAYAKLHGIPLGVLRATFERLGFLGNYPAAEEAYAAVGIRPAIAVETDYRPNGRAAPPRPVEPLTEHHAGAGTGLATGTWGTRTPIYVEKLAPCNAFCPAGNDVVGFVQAVAGGDPLRGAAILAASTPLPGVCGRVCPAPCMDGCNRRDYDGEVDIRGLERWIADRAQLVVDPPEPREDARSFAIVGGGPAGLAAAQQIAGLGHRATIFDGEERLGGVLHTGIPTYRLPREVLEREVAAVLALGVDAHCGTFLDAGDLARLADEHDGLILATGLQKLRGLDVPGADLLGIEQGIRFLHRLNTVPAEQRSAVRLTGHVVVLGGGNTAMDCARSALRAGARKVTIAYRRSRAEMPAIREEIEQALEEGVELRELAAPVGFGGDHRVASVVLAEVELGPADDTGRRAPRVTDRTAILPCDHVLLALGQSADTSFLPRGWTVLDGRVYRDGQPSPVFLAGDLATGDGTVTHAIGSGRRAAGRALEAAGVEVEVFERPDRRTAVPSTDIRFDHFARMRPAVHALEPATSRVGHFQEVDQGLADPLEAHRCFSCGHCTQCDTCLVYCPEGIVRREAPAYSVDYTFCKGCGICVEECPRRAMEMVER
jgi:2-oxoacid:acceptor oxidoreductase gamma subunit (pyruvate/2-ketoisovalerate family)/2-oxoacid:acceptor oxidoreductase delta subunit (pyruvate/2-ketoisovalerate family)